jgi:hypothetical protein
MDNEIKTNSTARLTVLNVNNKSKLETQE